MTKSNISQTKNDYLHVANFLIAHKSQIHSNYKPFQLALEDGHSTLIEFLGYDIQEINNFIFELAVRYEDLEVIECLIDKGVDLIANCNNALKLNNYSHVADFLIAHKSQIHSSYKPFQLSLKDGYSTLIEFLGYDILEINNFIFEFASKYGDLETIKCLIEKSVDFMANCNNALKWASVNGHLNIVRLLCDKCIILMTDNNREIKTAFKNDHLEDVKNLTVKHLNIALDINYAIRLAAKNSHFEIAKYLCDVYDNIEMILSAGNYAHMLTFENDCIDYLKN